MYYSATPLKDRTTEFKSIITLKMSQRRKNAVNTNFKKTKQEFSTENCTEAIRIFQDTCDRESRRDSSDELQSTFSKARNNILTVIKSVENQQSKEHWAEIARILESKYKRKLREQEQKLREQQQREQVMVQCVPNTRARELVLVERKIIELVPIFDQVQQLIADQGVAIGNIERNVDSITTRIDDSRKHLEDAAPRVFHDARLNTLHYLLPSRFATRVRLLVVLIVAFNMMLILFGII